jgi:hypothetical protein
MIHELKCWPEYFQPLFDGTKNFEMRKNDRNFKVGDDVLLREWSPIRKEYTGRSVERNITYIFIDVQRMVGLPLDVCVMQLK